MNVTWHAGAEAALLRIPPWRTSARIAAAVARFAETGEGNPHAVAGRPGLYELRPEGYRVLLSALGDELTVWSVHKLT